MKTLVKYIGIALASAALFTACTIDNYDQPNAWIHGAVIDTELNENILQDIFTTNGSVLMTREQNFVDKFTGVAATQTDRRDLNFKTDGTYSNKMFFSGTYEFSADVKNFYYEPEIIEIKPGENVHNIETEPYLRVTVDSISFHPTECLVYAYFKIESTDEVEAVADAALFVDVNPNVSKTLNGSGDNACVVKINKVVDPEAQYRLKMNTKYMKAPGDFWFRIGAKSAIKQATYNYAPAVKLHIDNSQYVEPPVVLPGVQIDACDNADGWNGGFAGVYEDHREGTASVGKTRDAGCTVMFEKSWKEAIDLMTTTKAGHVKWWLYMSDPACFPTSGAGYSAQFEFCSGGGCDKEELTVEWGKIASGINAGWNEVDVPMKECANSGFRTNHYNYFRMYNTIAKGECTLAIDDLRAYAPDVMDNCDSADGWGSGVGAVSVDFDCREGEGCISVSGQGSGTVFFQKKYDTPFCAPVDKTTGQFSMYMYVSDEGLIPKTSAGQIELTSGGTCDKEEVNWTWDQFPLSSGWNQLALPMKIGHHGGTNFDAVNFIRIYHTAVKGEITMKLDKIGFYAFPAE